MKESKRRRNVVILVRILLLSQLYFRAKKITTGNQEKGKYPEESLRTQSKNKQTV